MTFFKTANDIIATIRQMKKIRYRSKQLKNQSMILIYVNHHFTNKQKSLLVKQPHTYLLQ